MEFKQYKNTHYEFSNNGICKNVLTNKILKEYKRPDGYIEYTLCQDGKKIRVLAHRVVAQLFIDNPDNLPQVNHKNEIKNDNRVENLEWCTEKYNSNYGTGKIRNGLKHSKKVKQISLDGKTISIFNSIVEAAKNINTSYDNISRVCNGKNKTAKGYYWEFC